MNRIQTAISIARDVIMDARTALTPAELLAAINYVADQPISRREVYTVIAALPAAAVTKQAGRISIRARAAAAYSEVVEAVQAVMPLDDMPQIVTPARLSAIANVLLIPVRALVQLLPGAAQRAGWLYDPASFYGPTLRTVTADAPARLVDATAQPQAAPQSTQTTNKETTMTAYTIDLNDNDVVCENFQPGGPITYTVTTDTLRVTVQEIKLADDTQVFEVQAAVLIEEGDEVGISPEKIILAGMEENGTPGQWQLPGTVSNAEGDTP